MSTPVYARFCCHLIGISKEKHLANGMTREDHMVVYEGEQCTVFTLKNYPRHMKIAWCDCKRCLPSYSLSNVMVADEKLTSFDKYLRYSHKLGTIVFSIPSAIT